MVIRRKKGFNGYSNACFKNYLFFSPGFKILNKRNDEFDAVKIDDSRDEWV